MTAEYRLVSVQFYWKTVRRRGKSHFINTWWTSWNICTDYLDKVFQEQYVTVLKISPVKNCQTGSTSTQIHTITCNVTRRTKVWTIQLEMLLTFTLTHPSWWAIPSCYSNSKQSIIHSFILPRGHCGPKRRLSDWILLRFKLMPLAFI